MEIRHATITAIGTFVPEKRLTNYDLEQMVDTSDEWIVQRTGIRERRISAPHEYTSDLCAAAVRDLMRRYGKSVNDVDMIIAATSTPDFPFPSTASLLQHKLGVSPSTGAMDVSAACAGFVYGLHLANGLIASGLHRKILVVGGETLTKITDYTDRTTCVLFGDGAGAVLIERDERRSSFLSSRLSTEGSGGAHVYQTRIANRINGVELIDKQLLVQNGREVFKWAVRTVPEGVREVLSNASLDLGQVDWFVPHSANLRMIEPICERLGLPPERALYSLEYFGNTSAATIPLALDLGIRAGKIRQGDLALLYGFGSGLVQAGMLVRLELDPEIEPPFPL
ncbi:3-oxoacyl-[acyl-carrier-protein] synthase 3 protein 2 [Paenibacillus konkukensis]|uniref:Beta-ketoacyl-[acyl-carrier-protein] synthase III n=1 Tax=Paenibacillus konkukensis TaxID=2020716 RepID=A0ABY4S065_9BACL|nr:3-oxoacyl-[acyl-carrier-protein] synthase 3 protein 2 [Paenibacillus konkukensis]